MVIAADPSFAAPSAAARSVVLEIVIGAIVGPQVLGIVHPGPALNFMADFSGSAWCS